jgi:hypothetical protein
MILFIGCGVAALRSSRLGTGPKDIFKRDTFCHEMTH